MTETETKGKDKEYKRISIFLNNREPYIMTFVTDYTMTKSLELLSTSADQSQHKHSQNLHDKEKTEQIVGKFEEPALCFKRIAEVYGQDLNQYMQPTLFNAIISDLDNHDELEVKFSRVLKKIFGEKSQGKE